MKIFYVSLLIFIFSTLVGCDEPLDQATQNSLQNGKTAIGTDIKTLINPNKPKKEKDEYEYEEITWENLEIPGKGIVDIIKKFEKEIESIPEGSLKEKEVMERMQAELNSAPVNPEMDNKKIKLAGFVSPLEIDEKEGLIKEFLFVPYFGACIHVPPPPINNTLHIKPSPDQQIKLEDSYNPYWVSGTIHAERSVTKLAEAGYKISDVKIEPYEEHLNLPTE